MGNCPHDQTLCEGHEVCCHLRGFRAAATMRSMSTGLSGYFRALVSGVVAFKLMRRASSVRSTNPISARGFPFSISTSQRRLTPIVLASVDWSSRSFLRVLRIKGSGVSCGSSCKRALTSWQSKRALTSASARNGGRDCMARAPSRPFRIGPSIAPRGLPSTAIAAGTTSRVRADSESHGIYPFATENLPSRAIDLYCSGMVRITAGSGALLLQSFAWGAWPTNKNTSK